jgi:2-keto-myo-inositol isomerase
VNCESLLVCAEQIQSKSPSENIKAHVSRMSRLADLGKEYNVKIAIEWFQSLKDVIKIVETSNNENLGMIIDTFHWYRGDGDIRNIDIIPVKKLYLVHINDCEDFPKEKLTDKNRIYMGQGVIPLIEILQKLKRINYEGYLSVEIFRDEYWKEELLTISKKALQSLKETLRKAENNVQG